MSIKIPIFLFFLFTSFVILAQQNSTLPIHQEQLNLKMGEDSFRVDYMDIINEQQLYNLADSLDVTNYPLTILHRGTFSTGVDMMLEYGVLTYQYEELEKSCDTLTALHQKELEGLRSIIALERERAEIMKKSRDDMMNQMNHMNEQLNVAIEIENKARKRSFGKNFLQAALGGAVGFATGVILVEFAKD
ncbi:MAG: hypothetical protein AAF849_11305 [Bacteroidota bacterium]